MERRFRLYILKIKKGFKMTKSPATILASYIRQESLMTDPADNTDWPLYISYFPDVKTEMGAIYDTSGKKLGRYMTGTVVERFGITLKIRSKDYNTGWVKMEAIIARLDTIKNEEITVDGEDYIIQNVSLLSSFNSPDVEDGTKKRRLFVCDLMLTLK